MASPIDLSGWTVRDSALNYFKIPAGTVVASRQVLELQYNGTTGASPVAGSALVLQTNMNSIFNNLPAITPRSWVTPST